MLPMRLQGIYCEGESMKAFNQESFDKSFPVGSDERDFIEILILSIAEARHEWTTYRLMFFISVLGNILQAVSSLL